MAEKNATQKRLALEDQVAGLLYYYGVMEWDVLYARLRECFNIETDADSAFQYIKDQLRDNPSLPFGFKNKRFVFDKVRKPRGVTNEQNSRPEVSWRTVTGEEARVIAAGQWEELWGEPERSFLSWMKTHKEVNHKDAVRILFDYIDGMRNDVQFQDLIYSLSYDFPLESHDELQEMIGLVNQVWNHVPRWQLKGWSSQEVFEQFDKDKLRPLPATPFSCNDPSPADWSRIGRNDPCPCGSGKKFKKCCLPRLEADNITTTEMSPKPETVSTTAFLENNKPQIKQADENLPGPKSKKSRRSDPLYSEALGRLLDVFMEFTKLKPWLWMNDSQLFALQLEEMTCYVSVFGAGEQLLGLSIYPGDEGLQYYLSMAQRELLGIEQVSEIEDLGPALLLVLGDRDELTSQEHKIYKESPYRFRGRGAWPVFRSYQPGFWPWKLSLEEADWAAAVIRESIKIADYHLHHSRQIIQHYRKEEIPYFIPDCRRPSVKPAKWLKLPSFLDGLKQWTLSDIDVRRLNKIEQCSSSWEMDWFYLPLPVDESNQEAPFMPLITILADLDRVAVEPHFCSRPDWDPGRIIVAAIVKQNQKPKKILVNSLPKAYALEKLAEQLGFETIIAEDLKLDELRELMLGNIIDDSFPMFDL